MKSQLPECAGQLTFDSQNYHRSVGLTRGAGAELGSTRPAGSCHTDGLTGAGATADGAGGKEIELTEMAEGGGEEE